MLARAYKLLTSVVARETYGELNKIQIKHNDPCKSFVMPCPPVKDSGRRRELDTYNELMRHEQMNV